MRQRNTDALDDLLRMTLPYEIYIVGREDPIRTTGTFEINKSILRDGEELESFMEIATNHLLQTIDVVREHRFMLSDERFNKTVVLTDHIQAVSIQAPDDATFMAALEA